MTVLYASAFMAALPLFDAIWPPYVSYRGKSDIRFVRIYPRPLRAGLYYHWFDLALGQRAVLTENGSWKTSPGWFRLSIAWQPIRIGISIGRFDLCGRTCDPGYHDDLRLRDWSA